MTQATNETITLYGFPVSPFVRAAQIVFLEKDLSIDLKQIGPSDLAEESYGAINPFRKMPTLVRGSTTLYETASLMVYGDGVGSGASLQPGDPLEAARMWQFIGIAQNYLYPQGVMALYFHRVLAGVFGMEPDVAAADASVPAVTTALDVLEERLSATGFLAGSALTLADILCGTMVDYVDRTVEGRAMVAARPHLAAWLGALRARPSFADTYPEMLQGTGEPIA